MSKESEEFDKLIEAMNSELKSPSESVKFLKTEKKSKSYPLAAPFFQSPKLDPLPTNILVAADWQPGFARDRSRWDLTINQEGNLCQRIGADTPKAEKTYTHWEERLNIGADEAARLVQLANDLDFASFRAVTDRISTDVGRMRLSFRLGEEVVTYIENGCGELSEEHRKSFWQLWKEVHRHAPFPKR